MNADLKDIIFLDIETAACVERFDQLSERMKIQWARKASFLKHEMEQTDEDLFHSRAGIYAEFGKIIVVAIGILAENEDCELTLNIKSFFSHDERRLLQDFKTIIEKMDQSRLKLCAHNGKEFDFPYLSRRMLINNIPLPAVLNNSGKKPWEIPHFDTMEMWKFGDYKHYTSLDLLTAIFNIPTSKTDMDGSMVNEIYYQFGDLEKIARYCGSDVVAVAQLFLKMKEMKIVDQNKIVWA